MGSLWEWRCLGFCNIPTPFRQTVKMEGLGSLPLSSVWEGFTGLGDCQPLITFFKVPPPPNAGMLGHSSHPL